MKLYTYWRSSASYRVRIALNLKGIKYQSIPVNLKAGEQLQSPYSKLNAEGQVPLLELPSGERLTQSIAIIEYLETLGTSNALLSADPVSRAKQRAFSQTIASDIHPIQNLRVLKHLRSAYNAEDEHITAWSRHWISRGFAPLEVAAAAQPTPFIFADTPGLAECCLIPQIYNARRFGVDMNVFPSLSEIEQRCASMEAFQTASPENQPDADAGA